MEKEVLIVTNSRVFLGTPTPVRNDKNICMYPNVNCCRRTVSDHCILRIDYCKNNCPIN